MLFLVASYASPYFAKRPYLWTATAVGGALAVNELVMLTLKSDMTKIGVSLAGVLVAEVPAYRTPTEQLTDEHPRSSKHVLGMGARGATKHPFRIRQALRRTLR